MATTKIYEIKNKNHIYVNAKMVDKLLEKEKYNILLNITRKINKTHLKKYWALAHFLILFPTILHFDILLLFLVTK